ncbi:MAG: GtrA family protein [Pseudomonadota bacterium]
MPEERFQFLRFAAVGAAGFAADVLALYLALGAGLGVFAGRALSFLTAVWITWELNRRYTFRAAPASAPERRWWRYLLAMLGGGAVNYAVYSAAVLLLPAAPLAPLFSVAAGSAAGLACNYLSARLFVFRSEQKKVNR